MNSSVQGYTEPVFQVYESGKMVAQDAEIEGNITATSGNIGGFDINSTSLVAEDTTNQTEMSLSANDVKFSTSNSEYVRLGSSISSDSGITVYYSGTSYGVSASNLGLYQKDLGIGVNGGTVAINNPNNTAILANGNMYLDGKLSTTGYISARKNATVISSLTSLMESQILSGGTFICSDGIYVWLPALTQDLNGAIVKFIFTGTGRIVTDSSAAIMTILDGPGTQPQTNCTQYVATQGSVIEVVFSYNDNTIYAYAINNS